MDLDDRNIDLPLADTLKLARSTLSITNRNATLICAHFQEIRKMERKLLNKDHLTRQALKRIKEACTRFGVPIPDIDEYFAQQDLNSCRIRQASTFFGFHNWLFAQWLLEEERKPGFSGTSMIFKGVNSVINKWPFRPKLDMNDKGTAKELEDLSVTGATGTERYAEWGLVEPPPLKGEDREKVSVLWRHAGMREEDIPERSKPIPEPSEPSRTQKKNKKNRKGKKAKKGNASQKNDADEKDLDADDEQGSSGTNPPESKKTHKNNKRRAERRKAKQKKASDENDAEEENGEGDDAQQV